MADNKPQSGTRNHEQDEPGKPYSQERMPPISNEEEDAMVDTSNTDPHADRLNLVDDHRTRNQRNDISKGGIPPGGVPIEDPDKEDEERAEDPALESDIME